jgi:hypothetical protein
MFIFVQVIPQCLWKSLWKECVEIEEPLLKIATFAICIKNGQHFLTGKN